MNIQDQLRDAFAHPSPQEVAAHVKQFLAFVVQETVGLVAARAALNDFIEMLWKWKEILPKDGSANELLKDLLLFALDKLQVRIVPFEEQVSLLLSLHHLHNRLH